MSPQSLARAATARIQIVAPKTELAFLDSQFIDLARPVTPLEAWELMHQHPLPGLSLAFWLRDHISALFGVRRIGGITGRIRGADGHQLQVGDKLDFFVIETLTDNSLTLTVRDRHLDVMTCVTTAHGMLTVTSSVKTHNLFGRIYMLPVRPAHKLIVALSLKRLRQALEQPGS